MFLKGRFLFHHRKNLEMRQGESKEKVKMKSLSLVRLFKYTNELKVKGRKNMYIQALSKRGL